jgi:hypothetical protein
MLDDLDFYVAEITENESLKNSIKMVREILYNRAEENTMIDEEERVFKSMAEQRGMTKE